MKKKSNSLRDVELPEEDIPGDSEVQSMAEELDLPGEICLYCLLPFTECDCD